MTDCPTCGTPAEALHCPACAPKPSKVAQEGDRYARLFRPILDALPIQIQTRVIQRLMDHWPKREPHGDIGPFIAVFCRVVWEEMI